MIGTLSSLASALRLVVISVTSCTRFSCDAPARALQQLDVVDDQQVEALLPLQPPRARGELRDRQAAGLVDEERQVLQLDRDVLDLLEVALVDAAAPDRARRDAALLGDDAGGELLGRHFEREEADDAAVDGVDVAVGAHLAAPGARHVVGDVGGERGLAHAGAAGDDDQVGRLQAAHLAVEVLEPGREAGQLAVALIGARRHVDGGGERGLEFLEAAAVASGLGELVEPALGVLDLLARREIDRRVEGDVDHVLADQDQLAPDREVVDRAPVVHRVDDGGRFGGEAREILARRSGRRCRRRRAGRSSASPAMRACRCGSGCARCRRSADGSARRNAAARENR